MEIDNRNNRLPYFSVCIPQFNRTSFVIKACESLTGQTFRDFEVCISDDRSTDGRIDELIAYLKRSNLFFVYRQQKRNRRYDVNLRSSIEMAKGRFCFLLGNDDCFASDRALAKLYETMERHAPLGVTMVNYEDYETRQKFGRIQKTGIMGQGREAAVKYFRNFSFVSGVVLDRVKARIYETDKWDGSEMYQMYIGCKILSGGARLLGVEDIMIRKNIRIPGETVDNHETARIHPCEIKERKIPLHQLGGLVVDGVRPDGSLLDQVVIRNIFWQVLVFPYAFWILEYRRVQSWKYALGICLGMRPKYVLAGVHADKITLLFVRALYGVVTCAGLIFPSIVFYGMQSLLYKLAKRI